MIKGYNRANQSNSWKFGISPVRATSRARSILSIRRSQYAIDRPSLPVT